MKQFRIYTEAKNIGTMLDEVEACFSSITTYLVDGIWRGARETSCVIEIIAHESEYALVKTLAESIKHLNKQQAVCLTVQDVEVITL